MCNRNLAVYNNCLHQLAIANTLKKEVSNMVCEGLLFGSRSKEIIKITQETDAHIYVPKINELTE